MEKTTAAALVAGFITISLVAALIFGKITTENFTASLAGIGAFFAIVVGMLAGDSKTKNKE